jgi:hypothetical protein
MVGVGCMFLGDCSRHKIALVRLPAPSILIEANTGIRNDDAPDLIHPGTAPGWNVCNCLLCRASRLGFRSS